VPWAKPAAAPVLIEEFKAANDPTGEGLRWAIANGLAVVADDAVFEQLLHLVQDKQYGKAREMLVVALGNMKDPRAVAVLMNLLDDEEVVGHAVMALGKLKAPAARARLTILLQHSKDWVRDEAMKGIGGSWSGGVPLTWRMRMSDEAMVVMSSREADQLATRDDVERLSADLSVALHAMGDALMARWDRGLRRLVLTLSALMVGSAAAVMLVAWSASRIS
jgi:hypothetical protein